MGGIVESISAVFGGSKNSSSSSPEPVVSASQQTGQATVDMENADRNKQRSIKTGKQRLQIPTNTASTAVPVSGAGLGTGV